MVDVGKNLKIINKRLVSNFSIKKEGVLILIDYIKGDENYVYLKVISVINGEEYYITETVDDKIVLWQRMLLNDNKYVYSIRLPMNCDKIIFIFESDKDVFINNSNIKFDIIYNFWDYV